MATGFCTAQEEATKAQWELNVQIAELRLKAQPPTPLENWEQCHDEIQAGLEMIKHTIRDCSGLLEQSLLMLASLQEDPTIQQVEIEAWELQQAYDIVRGTTKMVAIMQQLAKMEEAQALKAQVDAARKKEAVPKECIQPWIDEAFAVSTTIEGKLVHMQVVCDPKQAAASDTNALAAHIEQVHKIATEFVASTSDVQKLLTELHTKITAPAE